MERSNILPDSVDLILRLITPLIIGGIAGLTICINLFTKIEDKYKKDADDLKKLKDDLVNRNEGKYKFIIEWYNEKYHDAITKVRHLVKTTKNYERVVIILLLFSIVILVYPFLISLFNNAELITPTVFIVIIFSYLLIIASLIIMTYNHWKHREEIAKTLKVSKMELCGVVLDMIDEDKEIQYAPSS